jgi:plasmid stability protein
MAQLLVRNVEESIVRKLKQRAVAHGVSVEEEHRRVLKQALSRPSKGKPSLMDFLLSDAGTASPRATLKTTRSRKIETHRDVKF